MSAMELFFWCMLAGAGYSYFLYPLILVLVPKRRAGQQAAAEPGSAIPMMTLIITAHNEENRIREKLINTLTLEYPQDQLEIIIASDASTDATDSIVGEYAQQGVKLVRAEERKGKEYAQLQAINAAKGEILVFSDVATGIDKEALKLIAKRFADPKIGAISSEDRFISDDGSIAGEGAYVKYEMWLRKLESEVYSLVGLSGSFFATRREVCREWDIRVPSDFNTALNCARLGYVASTDKDIIGYYKDIKNKKGEYARKLRTVIRGISAVMVKPDVLNPFKYGFFAFEVWSHKIMRWAVPWFMLALLLSSIALVSTHPFYSLMLGLQLLFYGLVLAGAVLVPLRSITAVKIPYYFMEVNMAIAHATLAYLFGKRVTVWTPSKR